MKQKKHRFKILLLAICISSLGIMAFQFSQVPNANYEPILMSRADMEASVKLGEPRNIVSPGKMWLYNELILLVEQYRGIHIIDNSNPSSTKTIGFIQIDGCTEITMKGDILYANNAVDMIGIKSSDFASIEIITRNRRMLPQIASPEPWNDWFYYDKLPENTVIVRWEPFQN